MMKKIFTLTVNSTKTATSAPHDANNKCDADARTVLRTVRRSLNEYRGGLWNGLILARNRLFATMFFTSLMIYALLVAALSVNAEKSALFAASIFFLVGATIGLASRLRSEFENKTGVYDYGLSAASLLTVPMFSGLTALGGIILIAMLPYAGQILGPLHSPQPSIITASPLTDGTVGKPYSVRLQAEDGKPPYKWKVTEASRKKELEDNGLKLDENTGVLSGKPKEEKTFNLEVKVEDSNGHTSLPKSLSLSINKTEQTPRISDAQGAAAAGPMPSLNDIFNLRKNLGGILIAVLFGFAPGLLFDRLKQMTDKYKDDLKSSQPTQGKQQT